MAGNENEMRDSANPTPSWAMPRRRPAPRSWRRLRRVATSPALRRESRARNAPRGAKVVAQGRRPGRWRWPRRRRWFHRFGGLHHLGGNLGVFPASRRHPERHPSGRAAGGVHHHLGRAGDVPHRQPLHGAIRLCHGQRDGVQADDERRTAALPVPPAPGFAAAIEARYAMALVNQPVGTAQASATDEPPLLRADGDALHRRAVVRRPIEHPAQCPLAS